MKIKLTRDEENVFLTFSELNVSTIDIMRSKVRNFFPILMKLMNLNLVKHIEDDRFGLTDKGHKWMDRFYPHTKPPIYKFTDLLINPVVNELDFVSEGCLEYKK